jgi:hypothetical protein
MECRSLQRHWKKSTTELSRKVLALSVARGKSMMTARELEVIRKSAKTFNAMGEAMAPIYVFELLAHVDEQAGQIATLKAALITERELRVVGSKESKCYPHIGVWKQLDKYSHEEATSQLGHEYPEIFAEENR